MASGTISMPYSEVIGGMFLSKVFDNNAYTSFAQNDDLNTAKFTIPGKYNTPSATIGNTITNKPTGLANLFTMLVYNPHNSDTGALGTTNYRYRLRIIIEWSGEIYTQRVHCENSTTILYEPWYKVTQVQA